MEHIKVFKSLAVNGISPLNTVPSTTKAVEGTLATLSLNNLPVELKYTTESLAK